MDGWWRECSPLLAYLNSGMRPSATRSPRLPELGHEALSHALEKRLHLSLVVRLG